MISEGLRTSKIAKSLCSRKKALRAYPEVTRRDGLSSWRVIFDIAVEKLSCSHGGDYVEENVEKLKFPTEEPIRFAQSYFSNIVQGHALVRAKLRLDP